MSKTAAPTGSPNFFRAWLSNPLRVAAVAPSGNALARLMTCEIGPAHAPVIELGPGTGSFTRALLAQGLRQQDLLLIETAPDFADVLEAHFPQARLLRMDASRLAPVAENLAGEAAGATVSGLPILSMGLRKQVAILAGCFALMRPGGAFYQFTYGPVCPVPRLVLDRLGLKAKRIGGTWRNIPPASVYRITRRPAAPRPGV